MKLALNCEYIDTCYLDIEDKEIRVVYHDGNILCNIDIDVSETKVNDINEEYILNNILSKLKKSTSEYEFDYLVKKSIIKDGKVKYIGKYNVGNLIGLYVVTDKDYLIYSEVANAVDDSVQLLFDYLKEEYNYKDEEDVLYYDVTILTILKCGNETKVRFKVGNITSIISFNDIPSHEEHYIKQLILNEIEDIYLNNVEDDYDIDYTNNTVKSIFDFIGLKY